MGEPARDMPERWNWTYPVAISPVDPDLLYAGSQHLWQTVDEGQTWKRVSPDLTRADPSTMGDSGGPIMKDQDGPEIYATIYTIAPSRHDRSTVWTGSDDGLVHLTRDGGQSWREVTPPDMPGHSRVGLIEASPHRPGTAYVSARRYEMDDRAPYLWQTDDYGERWTPIIRGIREDDFVYVVREDTKRQGLLYVGTEHGVYVKFPDSGTWQSLSMNLPDTPVTGLEVEERDLVVATHGRSFWVLDDIETLRQLEPAILESESFLFEPADAVRRSAPAVVDCYLSHPDRRVSVEILDSDGRVVRELHRGVVKEPGVFRVAWNLRYTGATVFPNIILEGGNPTRGPWAAPGRYQARLVVDGKAQSRWFAVRRDPRLTEVTDEDLRAQSALAVKIRDAESAANEAVILIRDLRSGLEDRSSRADDQELKQGAAAAIERMRLVEAALYQVKNRSPKDKIAYPIKLNDRLTGLRTSLERGDGPPTKGHLRVFEELSAELTSQLETLGKVLKNELQQVNDRLESLGLEPVLAPGEKATP
jgi:hypothetical protein